MFDSMEAQLLFWCVISEVRLYRPVCCQNGFVSGVRYRDEILAPSVRLYTGAIGYGYGDLTPLSTIFQPYRGGQFYW
jgi:hypothetical protein